MKGSMRIMSKTNETNAGRGNMSAAAMDETLKLYHAWLGYLLSLQGDDVLRVKAEEIRSALERFTCSVAREEDEYVIRLQAGKEAERG